MSRRKLIAALLGVAVAVAAVVSLRAAVQPPPAPAVGPDGERISAYHDPRLVSRPHRPTGPPPQPGPLHTDQRRGGVLVSWAPSSAPGFEVRWGRLDNDRDNGLDNVRYIVTPSVSLRGLAPGRYRVEVRAVDEVGQRSAPSSLETDVTDNDPQWQQGLGFVDDFERSEGLDPTRWRVSDSARGCLRREPGAMLFAGCGIAELRPTSPLTLGEPDADGVRGRVVLVTDAPGKAWRPSDVPRNAGIPEGVLITLSPSPQREAATAPTWVLPPGPVGRPPGSVERNPALPAGGIQVHLSHKGVFFAVGDGLPVPAPAEHPLPPAAMVSPGALHRWEVQVKTDRIEARRDGLPVTSAALTPEWREATVTVSAFDGPARQPPVRLALVGLTGPAPGQAPVRLLDLLDGTGPGTSHTVQVPSLSGPSTARLTGVIQPATFDELGGSQPPPELGELLAEVGGRRIPLRLVSYGPDPTFAFGFGTDIPIAALGGRTSLTLASTARGEFVISELTLEVKYPAGAQIDVVQPGLRQPLPPEPTAAELVVTQGGREVESGFTVGREPLDVEVRFETLAAQAVGGSLFGWVALRVELGGRRVLDHPTSVAGPAFAGSYRFTLDPAGLPARSTSPMTVTLVPDRPGPRPVRTSFTINLAG